MEDAMIIELFWARSEEAIRETDRSYGRKLHTLAEQIAQNFEDAQESVSDTYMKTWNTIPPQRPSYFYAFLAKICRNASLDRLDWNNAVRRRADIVSLSAEMEQCIPDRRNDERLEARELGGLLTRFLDSLSRENRLIFMRRYWYADPIEQIASRYGISQSKVKTQLFRTRAKLRIFLEKEGVRV